MEAPTHNVPCPAHNPQQQHPQQHPQQQHPQRQHPQQGKLAAVTIAEAFGGIGGFSFAFKHADHKCYTVAYFDRDHIARKVFTSHHQCPCTRTHLHSLDAEFLAATKQALVLCAGPPCTPWSKAQKGLQALHHPMGNLTYDLVSKVISKTRNPILLLEQVPGFVTSDAGSHARLLRERLRGIGYVINEKEMCSATYTDSPQWRKRTYIVAVRQDVAACCGTFAWPSEHTHKCKSVRTIIDINVNQSETNLKNIGVWVPDHYTKQANPSVRPHYRGPIVVGSVKQRFRPVNTDTNSPGYNLYSIDGPACTVKAHCHSNPGSQTQVYDVNGTHRRLTALECKRLMGFDNTLDLSNYKPHVQIKLLGNSVEQQIMRKLARNIINYLMPWRMQQAMAAGHCAAALTRRPCGASLTKQLAIPHTNAHRPLEALLTEQLAVPRTDEFEADSAAPDHHCAAQTAISTPSPQRNAGMHKLRIKQHCDDDIHTPSQQFVKQYAALHNQHSQTDWAETVCIFNDDVITKIGQQVMLDKEHFSLLNKTSQLPSHQDGIPVKYIGWNDPELTRQFYFGPSRSNPGQLGLFCKTHMSYKKSLQIFRYIKSYSPVRLSGEQLSDVSRTSSKFVLPAGNNEFNDERYFRSPISMIGIAKSPPFKTKFLKSGRLSPTNRATFQAGEEILRPGRQDTGQTQHTPVQKTIVRSRSKEQWLYKQTGSFMV